MSITQKDYLMRLLEVFAESLSRLIAFKAQGKSDEALEVVQETAGQIFGSSLPLIDSLDAQSAAELIVEPEKIEMYARLAEEEAGIFDELGDGEQARELRLRALEMYLERTRLPTDIDDELKKRIVQLGRSVPSEALDERYRSFLRTIIET
jgi:hypothetical protein